MRKKDLIHSGMGVIVNSLQGGAKKDERQRGGMNRKSQVQKKQGKQKNKGGGIVNTGKTKNDRGAGQIKGKEPSTLTELKTAVKKKTTKRGV